MYRYFKTVAGVRKRLEATSEILKFDRLIGSDGKERPVTQARPPAVMAAYQDFIISAFHWVLQPRLHHTVEQQLVNLIVRYQLFFSKAFDEKSVTTTGEQRMIGPEGCSWRLPIHRDGLPDSMLHSCLRNSVDPKCPSTFRNGADR